MQPLFGHILRFPVFSFLVLVGVAYGSIEVGAYGIYTPHSRAQNSNYCNLDYCYTQNENTYRQTKRRAVPQRYYRPTVVYPVGSPYTNYNNQYYYPEPYNPPTVSNQTIRFNDTYFSANTSTSTETRTNFTRDNSSSSYKDYDMYTFVLQSNGSWNNIQNSGQFFSISRIRELSTAQGRTLDISFGAEYSQDRVRTIRTTANNAIRTSQTTVSLSSSFTDTFYSLSGEEFYRQGVSDGYRRAYKTYKLYIARDDSQAFIIEYKETGSIGSPYTYSQNISGVDTSSFSNYGSYFTHNYRTAGNNTKQYKQYIYIPTQNMSISDIYSNLGINTRMSYNIGANYSLSIDNQRTNTYINGYTVNSGYVGTVESTFSSYGSPTYLYLPGSSSLFSFYPQTGYVFQNIRLSDGTYRIYRLLVATDGSEAYLTEYIENNPFY